MSFIDITDDLVLAGLVARAQAGEEVVLSASGRAVAKIVPVEVAKARKGPRRLGMAAGKFKVPDDFDAPLPDDVLALFYESRLFPRNSDGTHDPRDPDI